MDTAKSSSGPRTVRGLRDRSILRSCGRKPGSSERYARVGFATGTVVDTALDLVVGAAAAAAVSAEPSLLCYVGRLIVIAVISSGRQYGHSIVLTFRVHYIRIKSLLFWDGTHFWDFFLYDLIKEN